MTPYRMPMPLRRWLAGVLAALLELGPLPSAYAALTPLGDEPLNVRNSAQPNLILTVDDSTSMLDDFLPDYVVGMYCRGGTGAMTAACGHDTTAKDYTVGGGGKYFSPGYVFEQYNYPYSQYTTGYDASGPGAGCYAGATPTCSAGINPGSLPGTNLYPAGPQPTWPLSLQPYEYWLFWPAPGHSSSLNPLYYDPRLTYDPPVDSTGASYPQMDAGNTSSWSQVPSDPYAPIGSTVFVDLVNSTGSTPIYDGLWCNSDWNLNPSNAASPNNAADPKRCRYNGQGGAAFGTVSAADGQDYTYPWAPSGFSLSASPGTTTANTYAAQKVKLTSSANPTDPNYIKYGALFGEQLNDGTNGTPNYWNNSQTGPAQKDKYFYENENILWCDPTSPSWPQTGPTQSQTCTSFNLQACSAQQQTCCKDPGNCSGNPVQAACNGLVQGTCNNFGCNGTAGVCNGFVGGVCNAGSCTNKKAQTCVGTNQTCNGINSQTCSGTQPQTCQLPGTQTCQAPVCTVTYTPAGCNLDPNWPPEDPCVASSQCQPPVCTPNPGTCSISKATCTSDSQCPTQPGACSISGRSCSTNSDCGSVGHCSIDNQLCAQSSDCLVIGGTCQPTSNNTTISCGKNTDCPGSGTCSTNANLVCLFDSDCGKCNNGGGSCSVDAQCPAVNGSCNQKLCGDGVKPCSTNANCGSATCTNKLCPDGKTACTKNSDCAVCNSVSCSDASQCPVSGGTCKQGGAACTVNSQCPGTCSNTSPKQPWNGKACSGNTQADADAQCRTNGTCNLASQVCTSACTNINYSSSGTTDTSCGCPVQLGTCQGTKINPPPQCSATSCNQGQTNFCCSNILTCNLTHGSCNGAGGNCPNVQGVCSITGQACDCASVVVDCSNKVTSTSTTCANGQTLAQECPPVGKCSITKAQCTTDANCPAQPGPLPPSAAACNTGGVGGTATATLRADAEGAGVVCRRNNKATGLYTSVAYTYPSGKYLTPIMGTDPNSPSPTTDGCPVTNHYAQTPRHYWKSEVQWCDKKIATAGDKWLGYGTDAGGTCQAGRDATHIYPRFFQFGATSYVDNYGTAAFQRVDLDINNQKSYTHTWVDVTGQTQTITRSFAQEMTNYANWFAYYRTRIQAVKTVTSLAFTALDDQYRVGFATLSNGAKTPASCGTQSDPAQFVNIATFDATQKGKWWKQLFGITIPLCLETPTLDAMARVGEYFKNGGSADFTGSTDPIIMSCQKNWHMYFTDGFTNQSKPTVTVGDQDNVVPTLPEPVTGLTTGQPWPAPFRENTTQLLGNAASDYAMNYWVTDLRPSGTNSSDNVPVTAKDPASWQHLNFAALSLGTQGKLPISNQSLTEQQLANGTLQWPVITPGCGSCTVANQPDNSGVDDLWHAAINGRGRFVNAQTAAELKLGMGQILQDITNQAGARAGVGLASSTLSASNHAVYRVTFQPGWAGTVTKLDIDLNTGVELNPPIWEASSALAAQLTNSDPTCVAPITASTCPWFSNRKIFTVQDANGGGPGSAVPFTWGNLSTAQQDSLAPGNAVVGQAVLEWLRGNNSNEGVALGQFRVRSTLTDPITAALYEDFLGDIVDSQAVYVGPPNFPYLDANDPGYSAFVTANKNRPARVYVGANDGMVHAFDDANGSEAFAFIPHDLYRSDATGLGALSYQDGALPPFRHHYYVDSTPRIYDANFGVLSGSPEWHTLLVGGLGKGGMSYYAIDVTNPGAFSNEVTAATKYLWTFTDAHMGNSYGRPLIAKTRAFGGRWLAVVAAGYNNPNGKGTIFFVDAMTGKKLKEMNTTFGDPTTPAGLAHIAGFTQDYHNQLIEQIYGGDLYGHVWRFDVSNADDSQWSVQQLAYLTDPNGDPQPITTAPATDVDVANGVDRWVFVGTGRLLDPTDLTNPSPPQQQTLYAIRDGTTTAPNASVPSPNGWEPRKDFVALTAAEKLSGLSGKPAHGWYDDLPAGERIITQIKAALSVIAYAGTAAQDNPCLTGEPATLYARDFSLGESLLVDGSGNGVASIEEAAGTVGLDVTVVSTTDNATGNVDIRILLTTGTGASILQKVLPPPGLAAHRMSWRLLGQ